MILYAALGGAGAVVAIVFFVFVYSPADVIKWENPSGEGTYSIRIDPIKEQGSVVTRSRVTIENRGSLPLTNIVVDYGNQKQDVIEGLAPSEKKVLSPPSGSKLDHVTVSSNEGLLVRKEFRTPIAMPGMMGS